MKEWGLKPGGSTEGTDGPLQSYLMPIELVSNQLDVAGMKLSLTIPPPAARGGRGGAGGGGFGGRGGGAQAPIRVRAVLIMRRNGRSEAGSGVAGEVAGQPRRQLSPKLSWCLSATAM